MKVNKKQNRLLWFLLILLPGCSDFQEIEVGSPTAIMVNGIQDNKVNIDLSVPISNPNNLQFKITKINLEVIVNDNYFGKISAANNVVIPAKSDETHKFNLDLEIRSLTKGIITLVNIFGSGLVEVKSSGYIKARSGLISKTIPVENSTSIKIRNKIPWFKKSLPVDRMDPGI